MARHFPNFIKAYLDYTENTEAPSPCHFWSAVSAIAGAVRRQVWLDMNTFHWVPNFYIILVAPPGIVQKSTTSGIAMDLLRQVPNITFGPSSITWQRLVMDLSASQKVFQTPDNRFLIQSAITIAASELGTFLDPDDRSQIDILVDLWDSKEGPWSKSTVGSGEFKIHSPCLNLIAGTTPSWIANSMPEYMIGGGFTSRTIFVFTEKKRQLIAYPDEAMGAQGPDFYRTQREKLIADLTTISECTGPFSISPEARKFGRAWYEEFFSRPPAHLKSHLFDGYIARKQTHLHKLAMILSLAESNNRVIELHHLEGALGFLEDIEADVPKVWSGIGQSVAGKKATAIMRQLVSGGPQSLEELYAVCQTFMGYDEFESAIRDLLKSKKVAAFSEGGVAKLKVT